MSGEYTDAQKKASNKYLDSHDLYRLVMKKEFGAAVRQHAAERGESINAFITRAIAETMENDKNKISD